MVTFNDLRTGSVSRIKPSQLAKLANESAVTISRRIKSNQIAAITDVSSGRIFVPAEAALRYLEGRQYERSHLDEGAIAAMEKARAAKTHQSNKEYINE